MDNIAMIYLFLAMAFSALFGTKVAALFIFCLLKDKFWIKIITVSFIPTTAFIYFAVKGVIKLVGGAS